MDKQLFWIFTLAALDSFNATYMHLFDGFSRS